LLCLAVLAPAQPLPPGTVVEIRLEQEVNSYSGRTGTLVRAIVASPVLLEGRVRIPAGTRVDGRLSQVRRVGLGLVRETAELEFIFDRLQLPGRTALPLAAQVLLVDNARERVDARGRIRGSRATATSGYRAAGLLTSFAAVDPIALLFSTAAFSATLRFSDPEIRFLPGTDLFLKLTAPLDPGPVVAPEPKPRAATGAGQRSQLLGMLRSMPYRTQTASQQPSDLINLVFIGDLASLEQGLSEAGWTAAHPLTAASGYLALRALAGTTEYRQAPMSTLRLEGEEAVANWAKTTDTFAKRHHVRVFRRAETWQGRPVWLAAATHDIALALSRRVMTHRIDPRIDLERAKIFNELDLAGCIAAAEPVARPWVPTGMQSNTGQAILTDRDVLVVELQTCQGRPIEPVNIAPGPYRGGRPARAVRQTLLTVRNDVVRGNLAWQGVSGAMEAVRFLRLKGSRMPELPPERQALAAANPVDAPGLDRSPLAAGFLPATPRPPRAEADPAPLAPSVELGVSAGGLMFSNSSAGFEGLLLSRQLAGAPSQREQLAITAGNRIRPGAAFGTTVTFYSTPKVAHEFGFHYLRGTYELGLQRIAPQGAEEIPGFEEQKTGVLTRQFSYSTIWNLRRLGRNRVQPFLAVGPSFQLVHFTAAPFRRARGLFRLGLSNVGMLRAAYNFGSAAPLEGGGIFQLGAQFGAGVKVQVSRRWLLRLDYRDTISRRPDFLRRSLVVAGEELPPERQVQVEELPAYPSRGRLGQQRLTGGFAFRF
jgi:hypothetical protein